MSNSKKLALIAIGYILSVVVGFVAAAVNEALMPDDVAQGSPGMVAFGDMILFIFAQFAKATCGTIRVKLLKIGALVRTSVRRITLAMASSYPYQRDFAVAHAELTNATAR